MGRVRGGCEAGAVYVVIYRAGAHTPFGVLKSGHGSKQGGVILPDAFDSFEVVGHVNLNLGFSPV